MHSYLPVIQKPDSGQHRPSGGGDQTGGGPTTQARYDSRTSFFFRDHAEPRTFEDYVRDMVLRDTKKAEGDPLLDNDVLGVINEALRIASTGENAGATIEQQIGLALNLIIGERVRNAANSESLVLRDAERYLWGRHGIPAYQRRGWPGPIVVGLAPFTNFFYNAIKAPPMALNKIFGTHILMTSPYPFSPLGGGFWYQMGLSHYFFYDNGHLQEDNPARPLSAPEVGSKRHLDAEIDKAMVEGRRMKF
jgi:hypothetical protein